MFALGGQELLLLLVLGVLLFGAPLTIIIAILVLRRNRPSPANRVAELEAENRRLRDEVEKLRTGG